MMDREIFGAIARLDFFISAFKFFFKCWSKKNMKLKLITFRCGNRNTQKSFISFLKNEKKLSVDDKVQSN